MNEINNINNKGYIIVTDVITNDGVSDVSDAIQKLIDENPNRTIYFPDGTYILSHPIITPADPRKSVSLCLSDFAVLKAADNWDSSEAMVRLGAKDPANDIRTCGSNYSFSGGIIDGCGSANGISIDGGRETVIRNLSIKHTKVGLHIKHGANSGSSDCDIFGVNIIGNGKRDSVGVLLEGYDNTLSNMRIADVFIGVELRSAGNSLRNIHPLYTCDYTDYPESCGFYDKAGSNWYSFCYSDHFSIGFRMAPGAIGIYDSCFCWWYCSRGGYQTAVRADGAFDSIMTNLKVGFFNTETVNTLLSAEISGGRGSFERLLMKRSAPYTDTENEKYISGSVIYF